MTLLDVELRDSVKVARYLISTFYNTKIKGPNTD